MRSSSRSVLLLGNARRRAGRITHCEGFIQELSHIIEKEFSDIFAVAFTRNRQRRQVMCVKSETCTRYDSVLLLEGEFQLLSRFRGVYFMPDLRFGLLLEDLH